VWFLSFCGQHKAPWHGVPYRYKRFEACRLNGVYLAKVVIFQSLPTEGEVVSRFKKIGQLQCYQSHAH